LAQAILAQASGSGYFTASENVDADDVARRHACASMIEAAVGESQDVAANRSLGSWTVHKSAYHPCWNNTSCDTMPSPGGGKWRQAKRWSSEDEGLDCTSPIPEWMRQPRCPHWTDATTPNLRGQDTKECPTMMALYHGTLDDIPTKDEYVPVGSAHFARPKVTHGGNRVVPPEEWGLEVQQFVQFLNSCKRTSEWQDLRETTGYGGKLGHVNGYDVCNHFVVPYTKGVGSGVALTLNPNKPRKAQFMISHAWGEDMDEVLICIMQFFCCIVRQYDKHFPQLPEHTDIPMDAVFWFCIFSNYQCGGIPGDVGPTVAEQIERDPFGSVIRSGVIEMIVFETSSVFVHDRLWCIYEAAEALRNHIKVRTMHAIEDIDWVSGSLRMGINSAAAKCGVQADQDMITDAVAKIGGFDYVDSLIRESRENEFQALMSASFSKDFVLTKEDGSEEGLVEMTNRMMT